MHTTHRVGHTIRSRTCCHVVGVQGTTCAAARCYREVRLACQHALFLVGACNRVLETRGVGGVTCDADIHILVPHDSHALANIVCTIAVHFRTGTVAVCLAAYLFQLTRVVVKLSLHIGETVDTADNHRCVLAQTVQDDTERFLTHFVCHLGNLDSTLCSSETLVSCQEGKALRLLAQQTRCQVTMPDTYLAVVCYRAGNAEGLQTDTNCLGCVGCVGAAFLQRNSTTYHIRPLRVLKADTLRLLAGHVRV